jgi:hypothetical protein
MATVLTARLSGSSYVLAAYDLLAQYGKIIPMIQNRVFILVLEDTIGSEKSISRRLVF